MDSTGKTPENVTQDEGLDLSPAWSNANLAPSGDLDLYLGLNLSLTNRTGHPALSVPSGFHLGSPTALQMTGKLFGEAELLLLAHGFQANTDHHSQHPVL